MIESTYKKIVPAKLRKKIYHNFLKYIFTFLSDGLGNINSKSRLFFPLFFRNNEKNDAYSFMAKHGLTYYPFLESLNYNVDTEVFFDKEKQLNYVLHNNKKLYYPNTFTIEEIKVHYMFLNIEQDINSPHRYIKDFSMFKDYILFDLGAAEGIFALDMIEYATKVYLIECEDHWINALNETFSPWKDKIIIIKKFIGENNFDNFITLDSLYNNNSNNDRLFIKMDIEGAEQSALRGAKNILQNTTDIFLSVCTYHNSKDAKRIDSYLKKFGYKTELTKGFLYWGRSIRSLRKAIIRAKK
jgi:hypothetical protein